jgi:hypothetical protein
MIQLFKSKQEKEVAVAEYPQIVYDIHHEFENAGELLLQEANKTLAECAAKDKEKGKRLLALGFKQVPQAVQVTEVERQEKEAELIAKCITDYAMRYPNNKFITDDAVTRICEKYDLVCGEIGRFKGFVPEAKLKMIESFKVKIEDLVKYAITRREVDVSSEYGDFESKIIGTYPEYINSRAYAYVQHAIPSLYRGNGTAGEFDRVVKHDNSLQICAPQKDMDTTGMRIENRRLVREIPDPVVLQPVKGGYLIVCAWGDEASDPEVVNQTMN